MIPTFRTCNEKRLVGKNSTMSISNNKTIELWRSFMPHRMEIKNAIGNNLFSLQIFPPAFNFKNFDPNASFKKWAAIEVADFNKVPEGMETFILTEGLYAVFLHKGPASDGEKTFRYIFESWFPQSEYEIDSRPHFEILAEKYRKDDPNSEEEIWIPIKRKNK